MDVVSNQWILFYFSPSFFVISLKFDLFIWYFSFIKAYSNWMFSFENLIWLNFLYCFYFSYLLFHVNSVQEYLMKNLPVLCFIILDVSLLTIEICLSYVIYVPYSFRFNIFNITILLMLLWILHNNIKIWYWRFCIYLFSWDLVSIYWLLLFYFNWIFIFKGILCLHNL